MSLREAQHRQQQEQDGEAGGERRDDEDRHQHEVAPTHVEQQSRHQDRRQQEDERMRPEGDLLPEIVEERPVVGRDAGAPESADRQARREHGDDPGDVEQTLRGDEGEIGERDRQRSLGEPVVARPGNEFQEGAAGDHAQDGAAEEGADEFDRAAPRTSAGVPRR